MDGNFISDLFFFLAAVGAAVVFGVLWLIDRFSGPKK